jgi:hypothetical protein
VVAQITANPLRGARFVVEASTFSGAGRSKAEAPPARSGGR